MYAPISAARIAWAGENTSVTLIRIPSSVRRLPTPSPSGVIGTFTTAFGAICARSRPCSYIASASSSVVSSEIGPSTSVRISFQTRSGSSASLATSEGLVVTPPRTPQRLISRISSMLAVSRNSFTFCLLRSPPPPERGRDRSRRPPDAGRRGAFGRSLHDEVDDRGERAVEAVVGDHGDAVRQRLALDVPLHPPDVVEPVEVALRGSPRVFGRPGREVAAVHLVLLDRDHDRDGEDAFAPGLEVQEARHHVRALDDQVRPLHRGALDERLHADRDRRRLLAEPDDHLVLRRAARAGPSPPRTTTRAASA